MRGCPVFLAGVDALAIVGIWLIYTTTITRTVDQSANILEVVLQVGFAEEYEFVFTTLSLIPEVIITSSIDLNI